MKNRGSRGPLFSLGIPLKYRQLADRLNQDRSHLKRQVKEEKARLKEAQTHLANVEEAQRVVQEVAKSVQESAHRQIADVVTRCLAAVFDSPYEFKISFLKRRGKTEAKLIFVRDGMEIDPIRAAGGGVVDVAAFALRLACLMLARPAKRRLVVADEPFKHLSRNHAKRVRQLLEVLSKEMGVQIVLVTHSASLGVGHVIELGS